MIYESPDHINIIPSSQGSGFKTLPRQMLQRLSLTLLEQHLEIKVLKVISVNLQVHYAEVFVILLLSV